jgi:hypothetical protein
MGVGEDAAEGEGACSKDTGKLSHYLHFPVV